MKNEQMEEKSTQVCEPENDHQDFVLPSPQAGVVTTPPAARDEKLPNGCCDLLDIGGGDNPAQFAPIIISEMDYVKTTLKKFVWYHGLMLDEQVIFLLKWSHSFLVRYAYNKTGKLTLCLSIRETKDKVASYALKWENDSWKCSRLFRTIDPAYSNKSFAHIYQLIDFWSTVNKNQSIPVPRSKNIMYHEDVISERRLGSGAFGEVWQGAYKSDGGCLRDCAIKSLKDHVDSPQQTRALLHEALITSTFNHPCVIGFLGLCTLITPPSLILELALSGSVESYMKANKDATLETMLSFIYDISRGMTHIVSKKIIHRDLAARNCLIGSRLIVKISDFGLSVRGPEIKVDGLKAAPIRWMSPETLSTGIFNEKTDVWSFGVTIWEIFTKCAKLPLQPKVVKEAVVEIKTVEHPHKLPKLSPSQIVALVQSCNQKRPDARPTFKKLKKYLKKLLEEYKGELNNNDATTMTSRTRVTQRIDAATSSMSKTASHSKTVYVSKEAKRLFDENSTAPIS